VNAATGLVNLSRNLGASFGISLVTALLANRGQVHQTQLVSHLTPGDPQYLSWMDRVTHMLVGRGFTLADAADKARGMVGMVLGQQSSLLAFSEAFLLLAFLSLLAVPVVLLTKRTTAGGPPPAAH
jgi:MFS transporter, DHA2 family, multidrug resistance protein